MNTPTDRQAADFQDFLLTKTARGTSEYQVFLDAYRDWYGREPTQHRLESLFGNYLKTGNLPHFVRHYARHYVATHPVPVQTLLDRDRRSKRANVIVYGILTAMVILAMVVI